MYLILGVVTLVKGPSAQSTPASPLGKRHLLFPSYTELALLAAVTLVSATCIPLWLAKPYEWFLTNCSLIFILAEGAAVSVVIFISGHWLMKYVSDCASIVKWICFAFLGLLLVACCFVLQSLFMQHPISTTNALLTGSAGSLLLVLIGVSLWKDETSIFDGFFIFAYFAYCVANILAPEKAISAPLERLSFLPLLSVAFPFSEVRWLSLLKASLIGSALFRIGVIWLAIKCLQFVGGGSSTYDGSASPFEDDVTLSSFLFAFGKCILVVVYSWGWLQNQQFLSSGNVNIWNWLNIFAVIALYARNLHSDVLPFDTST